MIVDRYNKQSPQVDLLIYDRRRLPPVFERQGHGVYPLDAVLRIVEVKSKLDREGLVQFMILDETLRPDNVYGMKSGMKGKLTGGASQPPTLAMFAYRTTVKDIPSAIKKDGRVSNSVCICVANAASYIGENLDELPILTEETDPLTRTCFNTRQFMALFLSGLEEDAASRANYGLMEWLLLP